MADGRCVWPWTRLLYFCALCRVVCRVGCDLADVGGERVCGCDSENRETESGLGWRENVSFNYTSADAMRIPDAHGPSMDAAWVPLGCHRVCPVAGYLHSGVNRSGESTTTTTAGLRDFSR